MTDTKTDADFKQEEEQRRFKDANAARSTFSEWRNDNSLRSQTFTQVRNQLEGGRPKDPNVLRKNGTEWETNINFGDAQARRDQVLIPLWKAVHGAPHAISVTIESGSPDSGRWQVAMEEAFDSCIDDIGQSYIIEFMRATKNLVDYGCGPMYWEDMYCVAPRAVNFERMLFPKNTRMSMKSWEAVGIVDDTSPGELWAKIRTEKNKKNSTDIGWDEKAIKHAIVNSSGVVNEQESDWTRVQDMLVNNDIAVSTKWSPIDLCVMYVKQFNGKIGKYIFTKSGTEDFLFKNESYADSFEDIFGIIWYDTGVDAMVHSIKGFGIKNYHHSLLVNRLRCRMVDSASIAMALNFRRTEGMPDETPPIEMQGTVNMFPDHLEQIPTYPAFSQGFQILEMLEQNQASNNSLYRQQQQQIAKSDTATQANILATQQGEITEASMALYLAQVGESYFTQIVKRLRKKGNTDQLAKNFVQRLRDKQVPDEIIFDDGKGKVKVKCGTTAGMANPAMRVQTISAVAQYAAARPGFNMRWIDEQFISNTLGSRAVAKALMPEGQDSEPEQRRAAMMENLAFGQGMPLPVGPSDAHVEHIDEHLKPIEGDINQYKQTGQFDQSKLASYVIATEQSGQHLTLLSQDETRKQQFIALKARLTGVQSILRGFIAQIQNQQQIQQQQGQPPMQAQQPGMMQ